MRNMVLLIKPASGLCNLRCKYCFYNDLVDLRGGDAGRIMDAATAEALIVKAFTFAQNSITFAFQGGEPTLCGLPFFERFTELVKEHNTKKLTVQYAIQTNGMAVDDAFAAFFHKHRFLVGLSLDGTKDSNDMFRMDAKGNGSYSRIIKAAGLLNKYKVDFNILTVVTAQTARHIERIYNHFKQCGFYYMQFIPCLDPLGTEPFQQKHSLTPAHYEQFLKKLVVLWHRDILSGQPVSIRFFDNLAGILAGYPSEQCGMHGQCGGQYVIEHDGTVYPCDFYCVENWRTGNILSIDFEGITQSDNRKRFIESSKYTTPACKTCPVYALCRGGCRRDRDHELDGVAGDNVYCAALKSFYTFARPYLTEVRDYLLRNR